jgi:hypothetical protein
MTVSALSIRAMDILRLRHEGQRENNESSGIDRSLRRDEEVEVLFAAMPAERTFRVDEDALIASRDDPRAGMCWPARSCRSPER